ncbi:MAG: hypothetical protein ABR906_00530 [Terracidiphilus sp.]|jgi:hypothetical protein
MSKIADFTETVDWATDILVTAQEDMFSRSEPVRWLSNMKGDLQRSFNGSSYLYERLKSMCNAKELVQSMWRIEKNWDSYGAEPPNAISIKAADEFAQWAIMGGLIPDRIEPSAEGGVAVAFLHDEKRAIAEFLNDGTRDLLSYERSGEMFSGIPANGSYEAILAVIRDYFSANAEASC